MRKKTDRSPAEIQSLVATAAIAALLLLVAICSAYAVIASRTSSAFTFMPSFFGFRLEASAASRTATAWMTVLSILFLCIGPAVAIGQAAWTARRQRREERLQPGRPEERRPEAEPEIRKAA